MRASGRILAAIAAATVAAGGLAAGLAVPAAAAGTPDGAVAALLDAIAAGGRPDLAPLVCAERRDLASALDPVTLLGPLPDGSDPSAWAASRTVTVADRSVRVVAADEATALVAVAARIEASGDAVALGALVAAVLAASGQPSDAAAVAAAVDRLPPLVDGTTTIEGTVRVRADGDDWRVCGDPIAADDGRAPICDRLDPAAMARLLPAGGVRATGGPGSCAWAVEPTDGGTPVWLEARLIPGASLDPIVADWERGSAWRAAGHDGWTAEGAAWLTIPGGRLLAVVADAATPDGSARLATAVAEAIAVAIGGGAG